MQTLVAAICLRTFEKNWHLFVIGRVQVQGLEYMFLSLLEQHGEAAAARGHAASWLLAPQCPQGNGFLSSLPGFTSPVSHWMRAPGWWALPC